MQSMSSTDNFPVQVVSEHASDSEEDTDKATSDHLDGTESDGDDEPTTPWTRPPLVAGQYSPPPTVNEAAAALKDIKLMLKPPRASGIGYKDPRLDSLLRSRLEKMKMFLWNYVDPSNTTRGWQAASLQTARAFEKTTWLAGRLRQWVRAYILDREPALECLWHLELINTGG
jgi:hypothetical protein